MQISLIGFSGTGKSYWSQKLQQECGYARYECDQLIADRLEALGTGSTIFDLGSWLGYPTSPDFVDREKEYLALEEQVTRAVLAESLAEQSVIDTTGSVIYLSEAVREELQKKTTVVYIATSEQDRQELCNYYLRSPHPILWQGRFHCNETESIEESIRNCFPALLEDRMMRYQALASVTLQYQLLRDPELSANGFLKLVSEAAQRSPDIRSESE